MDAIFTVMKWIVSILDMLLPKIGLPDSFMTTLDNAIVTIVDLLNMVGYFLPLSLMATCFLIVFSFQNSVLMFRIGQWIVKLIRG